MRTRPRAIPVIAALVASGAALSSGSALAASINKCTTIGKPGSYTLTRNLRATGGDCLVVAADFVTIDLGGWRSPATAALGSG
jgi:hypothetical protein